MLLDDAELAAEARFSRAVTIVSRNRFLISIFMFNKFLTLTFRTNI